MFLTFLLRGLLALLLPETLGKELPETIKDGADIGSGDGVKQGFAGDDIKEGLASDDVKETLVSDDVKEIGNDAVQNDSLKICEKSKDAGQVQNDLQEK